MKRTSRFIAGLLTLLVVLIFTFKMKLFFGWTPDFVLALLIAFGMVFEFYEVIIFTGLAVWILSSQPWPGPELLVLVILALLSYAGRYFMPWQRWVSILLFSGAGIFALYAAGSPSAVFASLEFLLGDAVLSIAFAFLAVRIFRFFYPQASKSVYKRL